MSAFENGSNPNDIQTEAQISNDIESRADLELTSLSQTPLASTQQVDALVASDVSLTDGPAVTEFVSATDFSSATSTHPSSCSCPACCAERTAGEDGVQVGEYAHAHVHSTFVTNTGETVVRYSLPSNPNNFPPTVTVFDTPVELGRSIALSELIQVTDLDPNPSIELLRFRDNDTAPQSGFFTYRGNQIQQGLLFEVPYADRDFVRYHAGPQIRSEQISVEAFDGEFFSTSPGVGTIFSVQPNVTAPVLEIQDFTVLATEIVDVAPFINAFDPDGFPIVSYRFVERRHDPNGGGFLFRGEEVNPGEFFDVAADELQFLQYRGGTYDTFEGIAGFASDGASSSQLTEATASTAPNLFNPVVTAEDTSVLIGRQLQASELFNFSDADGNTAKSFGFRDTAAGGGHFTVNGVEQADNVWIWVDADQLFTVNYVAGNDFGVEDFLAQASDGLRLSNVSAAEIATTDVPALGLLTDGLISVDELQQVRLNSLVQSNSGVSSQFYEIIDLNTIPTSASILINGEELEAGVLHRITAAEFEDGFIQGGRDDLGRSLDDFVIRADNGFGVSSFANINVGTDPVAGDSLLSIGQWNFTTPTLELTYNFPNEIPFYYCQLGFAECTDNAVITEPEVRGAIREVLQTFENFFNVSYTEVSSDDVGDVTFLYSDSVPGAAAYAYAPGDADELSFNGDIFGTFSDPTIRASNPGEFGYLVWLHENGHSLGLAHPIDGPGLLPPATEDHRFTVLSTRSAYTNPANGATLYPITPQLYDIEALRVLYGLNPNFQTGNDQIRFDRDLTLPQTIYDAAGNDTFNLNNHFINARIDLRDGQFSDIGGLTENVAIAFGTIIENARGGSGNDVIVGNATNNHLIGGAGNDTLRGGRGPDHLFGGEGRDTYEYFIGDGTDNIFELLGAGRDFLDIHIFDEFVDDFNDPLAGDTLFDNFEFRRNGLDLEIRLTLDNPSAVDGQITINEQAFGRNRVETLRIFGTDGSQVGPDISLFSVFEFAGSSFERANITANESRLGNLVSFS